MKWANFYKQPYLSILLVIILVAYIGVGFINGWIHTARVGDQWAIFDSQYIADTEYFPKHLRFEYPQKWQLSIHEDRNPKNFGEWKRISLQYPYIPAKPVHSFISIHWRRRDDLSTEQACLWTVSKVLRDARALADGECMDEFHPIVVGENDDSAFERTSVSPDLGPFRRADPERAFDSDIFVLTDDDLFVTTFFTVDKTDGTLDVYQRFLDSLSFEE